MAFPGIATPGGETRVDDSYDFSNPEFGTRIESFQSPGDDNLFKSGPGRNGRRPITAATPQRPLFSNITNQRRPTGRNEFTPLLKSVHRSALSTKVNGANVLRHGAVPIPDFLKDGHKDVHSSPQLPQGSSDIGDSTYRSGEDQSEETTMRNQDLPESSISSTPMAPRTGGQGVLANEGQLTLKEQEKLIDEIKKENFSLKLKVFFLTERLDKLGPEYNDAAIKENIEIKVERASLKAELKRYKKSLQESEKSVAQLRQDMINAQRDSQKKYTSGREAEEAARVQEELQERLQITQEELEKARDELDDLREKAEEYQQKIQRLEMDEGEELEKVLQDLDQLMEEKQQLEEQLDEKEKMVDEKDEHLEGMEEELKEKEEAIESLEHEAAELRERVQMLEESQKGQLGEKEGALQRTSDALKKAEARVQELEQSVNSMQREHSDEKEEITLAFQRIERQNKQLEENNARLKGELDKLRDEASNKSFSYRGRLEADTGKLRQLQTEMDDLRQQYDDLELQIQDREDENKRLQSKINELNDEFDNEAQALRNQIEHLKQEKEGTSRGRNELETELRKARSELNQIASEKELLRTRHDALANESRELQEQVDTLKQTLKETHNALEQERELATTGEIGLKKHFEAEKKNLEDEIDDLEKHFQEREQAYNRDLENWSSEKRQLELRAERAEEAAAGLQKSMQSLQQTEHSLQGKEAKLAEALRNETDRHRQAEDNLQQQIQELQEDIEDRRHALDTKISELSAAKEESRLAQKAARSLEQKVKGLDDEINLLRQQLEQANADAQREINAANTEADSLRQRLTETRLELSRLENLHATAQADIRTVQGDLQADARIQQQLQHDLQDVTKRLETMAKEKHQLQDQLASSQMRLNSLQVALSDVEIERDELKVRVSQSTKLSDFSKAIDNEKIELKKAKNKLEIELQHAEEERVILETKIEELEYQLDDAHATVRELDEKAWSLEQDVKQMSQAREKEQQISKEKIARLETRTQQLLQHGTKNGDIETELAQLRDQFHAAEDAQSEYLHKEAQYKKEHRELRHKISQLEEALRKAQNTSFSSRSHSRASDVVEDLKSQLSQAQEQLRESRTRLKSTDRKLADQANTNNELLHRIQLLEQELNDLQHSNQLLVEKNLTATSTIGDLRKKIHSLERDLHSAQFAKNLKASEATAHLAIQEERDELYNRVQEYTEEIEKLKSDIRERDKSLKQRRDRERELDTQLRKLQRDHLQSNSKAESALTELERVALKYQRALERIENMQKAWEEERKAVKARIRLNTTSEDAKKSQDELAAMEAKFIKNERQHQAELRGLATQIRYLKAKAKREEAFRADLTFSKEFFMMQVDLFSSCNEANLHLVERMGITPDRSIRDRRPALRSVIHAVIAINRMQRLAAEWSVSKELRAKVARSLEKMRGIQSNGTPHAVRTLADPQRREDGGLRRRPEPRKNYGVDV